MKTLIAIIWMSCVYVNTLGQHYQVDTLYKTGPLDNRINVVILGDGFTEDEMPKFAAEAKTFADFFRNFEPYDRYQAYFNFFLIKTPSQESGITNPGTASDAYPDQPVKTKDTFYGVAFGESIHRMLHVTKNDVYQDVLTRHFPSYNLVIVIANTEYMGGATGPAGVGGAAAIFSLQENANRVGMHEIGHLFADLADEYWQYPYGFYLREGPNITRDSLETTVKWKNWLENPAIGVYRHGAEGNAAEWYKPSSGTCLMEEMDKAYCVVCRETIVEKILQLVNPVESIEPDTTFEINADKQRTFRLNLLEPDPNSLRTEWYLNGKKIGGNPDQLVIPDGVPDRSELVAMIFDSTSMSRKDNAGKFREKTARWVLRSDNPPRFEVVASRGTVCAGDTIVLTAYGCAGEVSWSTGDAGKSLILAASSSEVYKAECKTVGKPALHDEIPVIVKSLPPATAGNGGPYVIGQTIELIASGGVAYQWSGPRRFSADTQTATIPGASIHSSGTYEVKVTGENGCSKTATTEVKIEPILSVGSHEQGWFKVFPNPAKDHITVVTTLPGKSEIMVYNALGKKVLTRSFQSSININVDLPDGIYLCKFRNGNREVSRKVIIE
ncbi:Por secretion system C-terminal sorting domain-containing protein [Dyadobacter soli]|uniref:Por secretion system C-terminal sorting domain-containing protein n=1 Tax=Dyadobacter soli TaxID=659014 RepID=A0A1G7K7D2_9BACT|nr:M64 family metallopeptidase [Dyadobacter soli]SDF33037.1 Por secretion system C-terminal sorting domain-containing protein [Dyadobacter soli]